MRAGVTPVLIPNTMVKTYAAENTKLATAWEDRWLPDSFLGIWTTLNQQTICTLKTSHRSKQTER